MKILFDKIVNEIIFDNLKNFKLKFQHENFTNDI